MVITSLLEKLALDAPLPPPKKNGPWILQFKDTHTYASSVFGFSNSSLFHSTAALLVVRHIETNCTSK